MLWMQFVTLMVAMLPVVTKHYTLTMYSYFLAPLVVSSLATQPAGGRWQVQDYSWQVT